MWFQKRFLNIVLPVKARDPFRSLAFCRERKKPCKTALLNALELKFHLPPQKALIALPKPDKSKPIPFF